MNRLPGEGESAPEDPVVSVIVPAHNYARYLQESIGSVRSQTFGDWECLVVDDGSTDNTLDVLSQMAAADQRIRIFSQPQRGLSAARNRGLQLSRGRYIQFLDADDLLHEAKLQLHAQTLDVKGDVDIVFGPTRYFDDGERSVLRSSLLGPDGPKLAPMSGAGAEVLHRLLVGNQLTVAAPLVRRSVFDTVGTFDERLDRLEDWQLWLRCAIAGKRFLFLPSTAPVALIRVHGASLSSRVAPMLLAEIQMRRRLQPVLSTRIARDLNRRRMYEASAEVGKLLGLGGKPTAGLRHLVPVLLLRPRARWLAWTAALLMMQIPGGRRLVGTLHRFRKSAVPRTS